jgi:hypothetical protein
MKMDRMTKMLLAAIALAVWMIALDPWIRPEPVAAQGDGEIVHWLQNIAGATGTLSMGTCRNAKLCGQTLPGNLMG